MEVTLIEGNSYRVWDRSVNGSVDAEVLLELDHQLPLVLGHLLLVVLLQTVDASSADQRYQSVCGFELTSA